MKLKPLTSDHLMQAMEHISQANALLIGKEGSQKANIIAMLKMTEAMNTLLNHEYSGLKIFENTDP